MSDRTYCNLNFQHPATEVTKVLIVAQLGEWTEDDGEGYWFGFEEVNYARMPEKMMSGLIAQGIAFYWFWAAGGGYGPGVIICNGKETSEWSTDVDGNIVLTFDEIDNPEILNEARRWNAIYSAIKSQEREDLPA